MHQYYKNKKEHFKREMDHYLLLIKPELEKIFNKSYAKIKDEVWKIYETEVLEKFPYIGGDDVSGT